MLEGGDGLGPAGGDPGQLEDQEEDHVGPDAQVVLFAQSVRSLTRRSTMATRVSSASDRGPRAF